MCSAELDWGEARAMLVRDVAEFPIPLLHIARNQPEGTAQAKAPKSGKGRRVPLPDLLLPAIHRFAAGKQPDDLLFTRPGGGQLHRSMFIRATDWTRIGRGRTLHHLRHTAACEWIAQGVPFTTVQAWLGHGSIGITSRYHLLGDFADRTALQLLNQAPTPAAKPARRLATSQTRSELTGRQYRPDSFRRRPAGPDVSAPGISR